MQSRKSQLINIAYELFATKGYANVGMREICTKAGITPVQAYRLSLSKEDLLAEVSMLLTGKQIIEVTAKHVYSVENDAYSFVLNYLLCLYDFDIKNIAIRGQSAPYGWLWSKNYEDLIVKQVYILLNPIVKCFESNNIDSIESRCFAIWSIYYVGYRNAVVHGFSAAECVQAISGSLHILINSK